jgi:hypothetical protein
MSGKKQSTKPNPRKHGLEWYQSYLCTHCKKPWMTMEKLIGKAFDFKTRKPSKSAQPLPPTLPASPQDGQPRILKKPAQQHDIALDAAIVKASKFALQDWLLTSARGKEDK